jgi:hypothetical protein
MNSLERAIEAARNLRTALADLDEDRDAQADVFPQAQLDTLERLVEDCATHPGLAENK